VQEVTILKFFLATCCLSIKLLLHVYVGTRIYLFSDPDHLHDMDTTSKVLNSLAVAFSILLGIGVGIYVYQLTMRYVGEGQVALIEENLERFLDEEDAQSDAERGQSLDHGLANGNESTGTKHSRLEVEPSNEAEPRASMNWDTTLVDIDDSPQELTSEDVELVNNPKSP